LDIRPTFVDERKLEGPGVDKQKFKQNVSNPQRSAYDFEGKETVSMAKSKPNVFPKGVRTFVEDEDGNEFLGVTAKQPTVHKPPGQVSSPQDEDEESEYVSRAEFNELVQMVSTMYTTFQNLV
jgi:hypothetical protein